jgi:ABC-type sugar transport system ATPase subunit
MTLAQIAPATNVTAKLPHRPLLSARGIEKNYGGNRALKGVSLDIFPNEVVALVGDNGAGKSTFVKILSGAETHDGGSILVDGQKVQMSTPNDAHENGIATLYQDLGLVDCFNVPQNVFLGRELTGRLGGAIPFLRHTEMRRRTADLLKELDIRLPDLARPVSTMSGGQRQAVAISRLLLGDVRLIIMDEPMAALGVDEGQKVLDLIARLSRKHISFFIISHNMEHVMTIADRIAVFKNGNLVGVVRREDTTREEITSMIVHGRT